MDSYSDSYVAWSAGVVQQIFRSCCELPTLRVQLVESLQGCVQKLTKEWCLGCWESEWDIRWTNRPINIRSIHLVLFWAVPADLHVFALPSSHVEFGSSRTRMDVWSSRKLWSLPLGRCTCPSWRNSRARCTSAEGSSGRCTVHGESTFCYELLRFYCSRHMHGNFVMQKVIQTLPSNSLGFMIYELKEGMGRNSKGLMGLEGTGWKNVFLHLPARGSSARSSEENAVAAALHIYACRVLQRLIECCGVATTDLVDILLQPGIWFSMLSLKFYSIFYE